MEVLLDLLASHSEDSEVFGWLQNNAPETDQLGQSVLHHLVKARRLVLLEDYLAATPDLDQAFQRKDCWGNTPAHYLRDIQTSLLLVKYAPNAFKVPNSCKETPIHRLCGTLQWTDFGKLLTKLDIDLDVSNNQGQSIKSLLLKYWCGIQKAFWDLAIAGNHSDFVSFRGFAEEK